MAIQFLRGNKSTLEASQQIFLPGQPIYEQDSGQLKIGNGSDIYSALKYVGASSSGGSDFTLVPYEYGHYIDISDNLRASFGYVEHTYNNGFALFEASGLDATDTIYYTGSSGWNVTWNDDSLYDSILFWDMHVTNSNKSTTTVWITNENINFGSLNCYISWSGRGVDGDPNTFPAGIHYMVISYK